MSGEIDPGCTRPTGGPISEAAPDPGASEQITEPIAQESNMIHVGRKVPDFKAAGYHNGAFVEVQLSDYLGKWVLLCFYPGDFTFV